jgi:AcrR family transcriptional regulator
MSDTDDTETAFMEATYCALCEYGYADVTMQDIADQTDRSKASLHYHFDGKDDLFQRFLTYLHEDFRKRTGDPPGETPAERLIALLQTVLSTPDEGEDVQFTTAFLEIKAQAPYNEGLRDRLRRIDEDLVAAVADLVAAGVDAGEFPAETDPDEVASFVSTYLHGTWTRSVAAGCDVDAMRERLVEYVAEDLLAADASVRTDLVAPDGTATDAVEQRQKSPDDTSEEVAQ